MIDEEEWDLIFPPALKDDPETADDIARLLVRLDRVLDRPKGRELLHATFRAGVRKAFIGNASIFMSDVSPGT